MKLLLPEWLEQPSDLRKSDGELAVRLLSKQCSTEGIVKRRRIAALIIEYKFYYRAEFGGST
jgi:hypothetical protein